MLRMWKGVFAGSLDGIMGQGVDNSGGPEVCANSYLGLECPRVTGVFCGYSRRYFSEALRLIWLTETEGEILWITKIHVGCLHSQLGNCEYMTAFQYNHSFGFQKPMKVKVVKWGRKNWNDHDLMHIYHEQCEIIQTIEWKGSNGQIHCFHYLR